MHDIERPRTDDVGTAVMRAWLRTYRPNITVGRRGFLSQEAIDAYRAAHPQR